MVKIIRAFLEGFKELRTDQRLKSATELTWVAGMLIFYSNATEEELYSKIMLVGAGIALGVSWMFATLYKNRIAFFIGDEESNENEKDN